jgi:hypothetical protein
LTKKLFPIHDKKAMAKAWDKVKLQHSDATLDDAKDYYIMLLFDKKLDPIHGQEKIKLAKNKKNKVN